MKDWHNAYGSVQNPQTFNLVHVIYDDEFVALINSLSSCIKDYYKSSRRIITELFSSIEAISSQTAYSKMTIEDMFKSKSFDKLNQLHDSIKSVIEITEPSNSTIESIELNLNTFFTEAKVLFKKMKITRSKKLEESMGKDNKINDYFSNRRAGGYSPKISEETISVRKPSYSPKINQIRTTRGNIATNILSSTDYAKTKQMRMTGAGVLNNEIRSGSNYNYLATSLAKNIINFLNQMQILQESILKRTIDVQDRKKQFELLKQDIKKQAEIALLHSHSKRVSTPNKITINTTNSVFNSPKTIKENDILFMKMIDDLKQAKTLNERNESLISQLKSEMQKLICDNDKLMQENNSVKTDYNNLLLLKDKTLLKSKNIQLETIQVLQHEIKTLNDELVNKSKRLENTKKLEFEINKLKNEIKLANEENFEQEIKAMKEENYKLFEDLKKYKMKAVESESLKTEVLKLYQIIKNHEGNISNKENVILTLTENNSLQLEKIQKLQDETNRNMEIYQHQCKEKNKELKRVEKKILVPLQSQLSLCQENDMNILSQQNISMPLKAVNPKDIEKHLKTQYDQEIIELKKSNEQLKINMLESNNKLQKIIKDIKDKDAFNSQLNDKVIQFDNLEIQLNKDKDNLNNEISGLREDNKTLKSALDEKIKEILFIQQQSFNSKDNNNKGEYDKIIPLTTENGKLKAAIKEKDIEKKSLSKALQEKSDELVKLNKELEKYCKKEESINEINAHKDQCDSFKEEIAQYKNKINNLNEEIVKYENQIEALKKEIIGFKDKADKATGNLEQIEKDKKLQQDKSIIKLKEEKDKEIKELNKEISLKATLITNFNKTITQLKGKEQDSHETIAKLSNEIIVLQKDITKILKDKEALENDTLSKGKEIIQLKDERTSQQSQMKNLMNQIEKQKTEIASLQKIHNSTIQTLSEVNSNLQAIRIENNQLKDAIGNSTDQNTQMISHLNEELSLKEQQITSLKDNINSLQSMITELEADILKEKSNSKSIIKSKEDDISKLNHDISRLNQSVVTITKEKEDREKEVNNLKKEISTYQETLSKEADIKEELMTKIDIMSIELTKANTAKENTMNDYEKLLKKQENDDKTIIQGLNNRIDNMSQDHRLLDQNYKMLELKEKEYLQIIISLKSKHQTLQEQQHTLNTSNESNIKSKDNIIESLNEQIKKHLNTLSAQNNQKETYQEEILSLNSELTKIQIERANQKSLYEQKEEANTTLRKQITHLSNELSGVKEELEDKKNIINSLKSMIKTNDSKNDKEINDLISNNEKLREDIQLTNQKIEELKQSKVDNEKDNQSLKDINQQLENSLKKSLEFISGKDKDIQSLKENNEMILKEKTQKVKDYEQLHTELQKMTKLNEQNTIDLIQIKALLKEKETIILEKDKSINEIKEKSDAITKIKETEIQLVNQKNDQLEQKYHTIEKDFAQSKINNEQLSNRLSSKETDINLFKSTLDELLTKIDSKDNELTKTKELITQANSFNNKNTEDTQIVIQDITTKLHKSTQELVIKNNEIKRLNQELTDIETKHKEKTLMINKLNEDINSIKNAHTKATDDNAKWKAMIQTYVQLITTKDAAIEASNNELIQSQSLLQAKENELNHKEDSIKQKEIEINQIKEILIKAEEALIKNKEEGNKKISQLTLSCDAIQKELIITKEALKEKKSQLNLISQSNADLENEIKAHKQTINLLTEENNKHLNNLKSNNESFNKEKESSQVIKNQLKVSELSLTKITEERNTLNTSIGIIKEENSQLSKEIQLHKDTIVKLNEEKNHINASLNISKEEINKLIEEIKSLKINVDESFANESIITNQLTRLKVSNEDQQQKILQYESQMKDLLNKLTDSNNQVKTFEHLNSQLNNNYTELLETLNRLKAKHKELTLHNTSLEAKLSESTLDKTKMIPIKERESSLLSQLQLSEAKVLELTALLKIEEERNNEMVNKFIQEKDSHYHQVTDLEEENHTIQSKVDDLTKQIQELISTSKAIEEKYQVVQLKAKQDNDILEALTSELNQQKILVNDKENELNQAKSSAIEMTDQLTTMNAQMKKHNLKIDALTTEKKEMNNIIAQLKEENSTLHKKTEQSKANLPNQIDLVKEKELFILKIKEKEAMLIDTNSQLTLLKQQVKDSNSTLESQTQKINAFTIEKEEMLKQVTSLIEEINQKNKEITSLRSNIQESEDDKKTENLIIQEEYQKTKKENEKLQLQITKLTDQLAVLSNDLNKQVNVINLKEKEIQSYRNSAISNKSAGALNSPTFCQAQTQDLSSISPSTHIILHNKNYKSLTWYLLTWKKTQPEPIYKDFIWVSHESIQVNLFNKFKREEDEEKEIAMQLQSNFKNLELKEDTISKQNYEIKQLKNQKNQSANFNESGNKDGKTKYSEMKLFSKENINITSPNFPISMDKYNELLQQINSKDLAIAQLQKEVKDGREKHALEANCSGIQEKNSSGFLDDIGFTNVIEQFDEKKSNKPFSSAHKGDEEHNKHIQEQLTFLKSEIKNLNTKQSEMNDNVISLIKNSQINGKTKPFVIAIGKTLGYTEESWMKFVNAMSEDKDKKKGVMGFFGGGKK